MSRFDATTPSERRELFADAIAAHRERESRFLTVEADTVPAALAAEAGDEETERIVPWVQFDEDTFNLDCTDAELTRLKTLVDEYPAFRIDALESPEEAEGTNVRITAYADTDRLAAFADRTFREVYLCPEDFRAWVTDV